MKQIHCAVIGKAASGKTTLISGLTSSSNSSVNLYNSYSMTLEPEISTKFIQSTKKEKDTRLVLFIDVPGHDIFREQLLSYCSEIDLIILTIDLTEELGEISNDIERWITIAKQLSLGNNKAKLVVFGTKCDSELRTITREQLLDSLGKIPCYETTIKDTKQLKSLFLEIIDGHEEFN